MDKCRNIICEECILAYNGLNGRYCSKLQKYVTYYEEPPCLTIKDKEDEINQRQTGGMVYGCA